MIQSRTQARRIARELERRRLIRIARASLFDKQVAFKNDPAKFKAALCTRRAGKSHTAADILYDAGEKYPNAILPYIALTRASAKNIMWPVLTEVNEKYGIGAKLTESDLTATLPNGARVVLFGADMKNFINRLRGIKTPRVVIDEAQSFRSHLVELIDDVITPALIDYDGDLNLFGTPGPLTSGVFYEATEKNIGYSVHKWSIHDNPYIKNARGFIEGLKKKRGWTDQNPTYLREYCGQWVLDINALVYRFVRTRNLYRELPSGHEWERILAVDYGWNDQTAFGVITYAATCQHVFLEHVEGHAEMVPSDIAEKIKELQKKYRPFEIVADTGGLGKSITEEFRQRWNLPIKPADKTEKLTHQRLLNGDLIDRKLWIHESLTPLHDQLEVLVKGPDGKEDPTLPNDLCDVMLYGYRRAKHYLGEEPVDPPEEGTPEHAQAREDALEQSEIDRFLEEQREEADLDLL